jgi:uncharacterized protein involved in exopolysaccharide biosynthesis
MNGFGEPQVNGQEMVDHVPPRVNLQDYLEVLGRYRWKIVAIVLGGSILVATYLMLAPQTFIAGGTLLPPDKSESLNLAALATSSKLDFKALSENSSAETLVRIITSRTMCDSLIARFKLFEHYHLDTSQHELLVDIVQSNFVVSSDRQGFIDIGYAETTGYLPSRQEQRAAADFSARMVNASIEILDKLNQQKSVSRARRSREFIGRMLKVKRAELDSVQLEMLRFQQQNKAIALDKQIEASVSGLVDLQTQIQKKELELGMAEQQMSSDAPPVDLLRKQLAQLKSQRDRLENGRVGSDALGIPLRGVPELTRQLVNLKLSQEVATQVYTYLEAQYNQEQISEARELPTVSVLDPAEPPLLRSAPRRVLMVSVAFVTLLLLAVIGVFIVDAYRRNWRSADAPRRSRRLRPATEDHSSIDASR